MTMRLAVCHWATTAAHADIYPLVKVTQLFSQEEEEEEVSEVITTYTTTTSKTVTTRSGLVMVEC